LSSAVPSIFTWTTDTYQRTPSKRRCQEAVADQTSKESDWDETVISKPPSGDHDYCLFTEEEIGDVHAQLMAAKKEIEKLQKELERAKCLSKFGLSRYSYSDDMINFYTGFPSWKLLEMFISLVKPGAE